MQAKFFNSFCRHETHSSDGAVVRQEKMPFPYSVKSKQDNEGISNGISNVVVSTLAVAILVTARGQTSVPTCFVTTSGGLTSSRDTSRYICGTATVRGSRYHLLGVHLPESNRLQVSTLACQR